MRVRRMKEQTGSDSLSAGGARMIQEKGGSVDAASKG